MPVDIRKPFKKLVPHLLQAKADNLNEADTVRRITKVFEEVFGYDPMTDITSEAPLKGKFVDLSIKIDGVVRLLVEAKAAGETLRDRHIEQAESYGSRNNFRWVLLTNGTIWNLYHLTFGEGIERQRVFSVDLSDSDALDATADKLALLHKQAIKKGELDRFWETTTALNPATIGRALLMEHVLAFIRREIRRETEVLIDPEDLAAAIYEMLSPEAKGLVGELKIRRRRAGGRRMDPGSGAAVATDKGQSGAKRNPAAPPAEAAEGPTGATTDPGK